MIRVTHLTIGGMENFSQIFSALRDLTRLKLNFTQCQVFNDERFTKLVTYLHSLKNIESIDFCFKEHN